MDTPPDSLYQKEAPGLGLGLSWRSSSPAFPLLTGTCMLLLNASSDGVLTTQRCSPFLKGSVCLASEKPRGEGDGHTATPPDGLIRSLKPVGATPGVCALSSQPQARSSPYTDTDPREGVALAWLQGQREPLPPSPSACPDQLSSSSALQPLSGVTVDLAIMNSEKWWPQQGFFHLWLRCRWRCPA